MTSEEKVPSALTLRLLVMIPIVVVLSVVNQLVIATLSGAWWAHYGIFPFPTFVFLLIIYGLSKISPRLMLTPQEFTLFFTVIHVCAGWHFEEFGMVELGAGTLYQRGFIFESLWMAGTSPYSEMAKWVPDHWAPISDPTIVENAMYGGPVNWAAYMPALIWQIVHFLLWMILGWTWAFFLRKPLIEVEKLPFSGMQVSIMTTDYFYSKSPAGKPKVFDLKLPLSKLFWIGVVLGFIFNSTGMVRFLLPIVPPTWAFVWWVDLTPITRTFLPGAYMVSNFRVTDVFLAFLVPIDAAASIIIFHFIFSVLYHSIGVWTGILPYYVGVETISRNYYGWEVGPFKYQYICSFGCFAGVAIWLVYANRKHFANIFKAAFGAKDVPQYESGVSYRIIVIGALASFIGLLIQLTVDGMPFFVSLVYILWYIATLYLFIRFMAEYWEPLGRQGWVFAWPTYDAGALLGYWPAVPPGGEAVFRTAFLMRATYTRGLAYDGDQTFPIYKFADHFNVSARDILKVLVITTVITAIISYPFALWWHHVYGLSRIEHFPYYKWDQAIIYSMTISGAPQWGFATGVPFAERAGLTLFGTILTIAMFALRSRFAWFFLNPTFLWMTTLQEWFWLATFVALIIKIIVLRIGGAKMYTEYGVPLSVGVLTGFGIAYLAFEFLILFTTVLPKLLVGAV
jgi:hypothetical protein